MENLKRPTQDETDHDLLKQQEEFLKDHKRPAAHFKSAKSPVVNPNQNLPENITEANEDPKFKSESIDSEFDEIILDVKENDFTFTEPFVFKPLVAQPKSVNVDLKKFQDVKKFSSHAKSKSIFSQMINCSKDKNVSELPQGESKPDAPVLVDGSGLGSEAQHVEVQKIHEENLAKLSSMSKEEILYHQEQLKQFLKPEVLSFIQRKKNTPKSPKSSHRALQPDSTTEKEQCSGEILRKEGNKDCDALILEKALNLESQSQNSIHKNENSCKNTESKDFEMPKEVKDFLKTAEVKDEKGLWKNIKIEKEKLAWMADLPKPKPVDIKTGYTARFDFEGKLIDQNADIPTHQGLHHHGQDPEVPGYSLEELFLLARSSLQSQRITALNTLAHILENNWCGMMDNCFDSPLLPMLLNAGIVPLLRWALDDTSLTSISATISAIHSLLISKADEACLQKTFCWPNGHIVPQLEPQGLEEPNLNIEELTDADLIKLDVIKGFLRIDIMPRFMYILKVMCPPPSVCQLIIEICARLAQHSPESALQVAEHQDFLKLIFEKFLPLTWNFVDSSSLTDTVNYSCPNHSALKLMRIIVSSSEHLAIKLIENFGMASLITFYLTIQPVDGKLPASEVQLLVIETLKVWLTFLCYGILSIVFLNIFPIFLKQLDFCLSLNLNGDTKKQIKDLDYASHLFKVFEAVAVVASEAKDDELSTAVNVVFKKAIVCLKKWIWQFSQESMSSPEMCLLAACMNFVVTYCKKSHEGQLTCEDFEHCGGFKEVFEKSLLSAMKSKQYQNLLKNFKFYSLLLCSKINGNKRDDKTIVSLGSVLYGEDIVPILKDGTSLPLLSAILNYVILYNSFFQFNSHEVNEIIFCSPVTEYLSTVSCKETDKSSWFLQFETLYVYQLIQLSKDSLKSQELAVSVLPLFITPQECLVEDLLKNTIFDQNLIIKMALNVHFADSNQKNDALSIASLLPVIADCYSSCFLTKESVERSRSILFRSTNISSLFQVSTPSVIIEKDWCYKPIYYLYQKSKHRKSGESLSPEETLQVICSLQWVYLCHLLNLQVLKEMPASAEVYYLCMVFLVDEDIFRDEKVKNLLVKSVSLISKQKNLNLSKINWNGIKSFSDLYLELLTQYEAVSFGDETFGNFLLLALQQNCPTHWKKVLLTEHSDILSFFRVHLTQMLVPIENFLLPVETDYDLISVYLRSLAGSLNPIRCPVLHLMAVHHIHSFLFIKSDDLGKFQKNLLEKILKCDKELQRKILLYSKYNEASEYGFLMSEELSSTEAAHLSKLIGAPIKI